MKKMNVLLNIIKNRLCRKTALKNGGFEVI